MSFFTPVFVHTNSGVVPVWFPTQALANDIREWDVSITPAGTVLTNQIVGNRLRVGLYRLLLEAGLAFTQGVGLQLPSICSLAPIYRYIDLFTGTDPRLRLIGGLENVDSRFKQLIAEEVSLGIAWYVLKEHMGAVHIADAGPLLNPPPGEIASLAFTPGHLDEKRPDFYCETAQAEIVLAESKGTIGPRSTMTGGSGPLNNGWHQVNNVIPTMAPIRAQCGRVVIGTNIQLDLPRIRSDSLTHIRDPIGPGRDVAKDENDFAIRVSYAKILKYLGELTAAELLLARQQWPSYDGNRAIDWNGFSLVPVGFAPIGGLVTIERRVFNTLRDNHLGSLRTRLAPYLSAFDAPIETVQANSEVIVFRNGVVVFVTDHFVDPDVFLRFPWSPLFRPSWYR